MANQLGDLGDGSTYDSGNDSDSYNASLPSFRLLRRDWEADATKNYNDASASGCQLYAKLQNNQEAASVWTDYGSLKKYGWVPTVPAEWAEDNAVIKAVEAIGAPNTDGATQATWWHSEQSVVNGVTYKVNTASDLCVERTNPRFVGQPTYRSYKDNYYPTQGVIVAGDNHGPVHVVKNSGMPWIGAMVPLTQWSDVVYLEWQHLTTAGDQRKGIKYIVCR